MQIEISKQTEKEICIDLTARVLLIHTTHANTTHANREPQTAQIVATHTNYHDNTL